MNFLFLKANLNRFNKNTKKYLAGKQILAYVDLVYSFMRFGCSPDDYFRYRFYEKSTLERNKFITYKRSKHIIKQHI